MKWVWCLLAATALTACGKPKKTSHREVVSEPPAEEPLYCSTVVTTITGPRCAGKPLEPKVVSHRNITYVLRREEGRVHRVERRTGRGALVDDDEGVALTIIEYENGAPVRHRLESRTGLVQWVKQIEDGGLRIRWRDAFGRPKGTHNSDVVEERVELGEKGWAVTVRFFDAGGKPATDRWGSFARRYVRRDDGARLELAHLDAELKPMLGVEGMATILSERDDFGHTLRETYLDAAGQRTTTASGQAEFRSTLDAWGNDAGGDFFDLAGRPAYDKRNAFAWRTKFDDGGCPVEFQRLDAEGKPMLGPEGYSKRTSRCDDRGRQLEWGYFREDGSPATYPGPYGGYTRVTYELDEAGNFVSAAFFSADDKPLRVARERKKYGPHGLVLQVTTEDADGRPVTYHGYATERRVYDDTLQNVETAYFDPDDKPANGYFGYAKVTRRFDDKGEPTEELFTDAKGAPVKTYRLRAIRVFFDIGDKPVWRRTKAEARTRAEEARRLLREGAPFDTVILSHSDRRTRPRDGTQATASFFPSGLREAIVRLNVGDVSDVVETPSSFDIVQLEE